MGMWSDRGASIEAWAREMADRFFLSEARSETGPSVGGLDGTTPNDWIALEPDDWLPLIEQLDTIAELDDIIEAGEELLNLVEWEAIPTALLEAPLDYLEGLLEEYLSWSETGQSVDWLEGFGLWKGRRRKGRPFDGAQDRHLLEISLAILRLGQELSESAREAVTAWANLQRHIRLMPLGEFACETCPAAPFCDELTAPDLPPAVRGFSLLVGLSLMRWPQRAGGLGVSVKMEPALYTEMMERWQALPDDEVSGPEALFAQGQLAHFLSRVGTVNALGLDVGLDPFDSPSTGLRTQPFDGAQDKEQDTTTLYSRLSRAMLLIHNRCRHCEERADLACQAVAGWEEGPCPLMDIAASLVITGSLAGCPKVEQGSVGDQPERGGGGSNGG
jgi:hypothetical protein